MPVTQKNGKSRTTSIMSQKALWALQGIRLLPDEEVDKKLSFAAKHTAKQHKIKKEKKAIGIIS